MTSNTFKDTIQTAWNLATAAHINQFYTNHAGQQLPYINHIGAVVNEVYFYLLDNGTTYNAELLLLCAILHDTLEDTELTFDAITETFGATVANGVLALTKNADFKDKDLKMRDSLNRILQQPPEVAMVKMADRIVNLQPPPNYWTADKRREYYNESVLLYDSLKDSNPVLAQRLLYKIESYEAYL